MDKRPLYRLPRLPAEHDGPVWIVASEQLVDALHLIRPAEVSTAMTTACRAQPQRHFADLHLSPLYRKQVFCIAEQTARSRKGMRELATLLREQHQARPTLVLPQGEGRLEPVGADSVWAGRPLRRLWTSFRVRPPPGDN